ncbi:DUF448 domain-containing protein [Sphingomonas xanthus]|uniref:DUF448 domain-containing protein n=1 Tax=Sphingomonas xanthus TaxID=2594473 RepID=A0A516ISU8_9SPHN|nr:DUF448 domain-containing protein [Sphingomonas xanthus]QDP19966.1 DUF448 domain-containing protein [Sphingomonas xanthus]
MRTPPNEAVATDTVDEGAGPERTCVLSRVVRPKDALVRLALGPDGQVAPDVRARAPGRGAWIGVDRRTVDEANAKGRLKGALSRAFKTQALEIPSDLGERIETALRQHALDRLGLEARGGMLVNGAERVEAAARQGKVHLLIHAADAGADGRRKLDQAWRVGGGGPAGLEFPEPRTILSMALGRENVVHIALTDAAAARRVLSAIARWRAFIDPDAGLDGGDAAGPDAGEQIRHEGNA